MKVTLVVSSGAHQGKVIPITGSQFLIGRDAQCHLRPASQAISKQHCGVLVRDGTVYVKDYGSTNGTTVNAVLVKGAEVAVENGASLKLGPLDFTVRIELTAPNPDGTPLPGSSPEATAALAAVKAAAGSGPKTPLRDATPNPARTAKPTGSKESPALNPAAKPSVTGPVPTDVHQNDHDKMAAMLLGMDDDESIPGGSTVVEMPAVDANGQPLVAAKPDEKGGKKPVQTREDMSSAANDLLRKMMRRPK